MDDTRARFCQNCGGYLGAGAPGGQAGERDATQRVNPEQDRTQSVAPADPDQTTAIPPVSATPEPARSAPGSAPATEQSAATSRQPQVRATPRQSSGPPPRRAWRGWWVLGGGLVAGVLVGLVVVALVGDDDGASEAAPSEPETATSPLTGSTGEPEASPTADATEPAPTTSPAASTDPTSAPDEDPVGPETPAWVAVLQSLETSEFDQAAAQERASTIADETGGETSVLLSEDFGSLNPGFWVVYADGFADEDAADGYCASIEDAVPECYGRLVEE